MKDPQLPEQKALQRIKRLQAFERTAVQRQLLRLGKRELQDLAQGEIPAGRSLRSAGETIYMKMLQNAQEALCKSKQGEKQRNQRKACRI